MPLRPIDPPPAPVPPDDDDALRQLARELFADTQQAHEWERAVQPVDRSVLSAALRAVLDKLPTRN